MAIGLRRGVAPALVLFMFAASAALAERPDCPTGVDSTASSALPAVQASADVAPTVAPVRSQANCATKTINGFPVPDPTCTPGAINPTVTLAILQGGDFRTGSERDTASSAQEKQKTYSAYGLDKPQNNTGRNQVCELDHLVSLEIGGADTVDNIWPQCGPDGVALQERYFKIKDGVENYLAAQVRSGNITLSDAQHGIATNWTQYIDAAKAFWKTHKAHGFGRDQ